MKKKVIMGLILALTLGPAIYFGRYVFFAVVLVFMFLGSFEIQAVFKEQWPKWIAWLTFVDIMALYLVPSNYLMLLLIVNLLIVFVFTIFFDWFHIEDGALWFLLLMIVGLGIHGLSFIIQYDTLVILYVALATYITYYFAYLLGMRFGKHKLAPRISPNKSIEGAVGGYLFGSVASFIYGFLLLKQYFDVRVLIIGALLMPIVGQIGDLAFSAIKRFKQIKDFGELFPEHGGILDRIDSLLFNLMFFYAIIVLFN